MLQPRPPCFLSVTRRDGTAPAQTPRIRPTRGTRGDPRQSNGVTTSQPNFASAFRLPLAFRRCPKALVHQIEQAERNLAVRFDPVLQILHELRRQNGSPADLTRRRPILLLPRLAALGALRLHAGDPATRTCWSANRARHPVPQWRRSAGPRFVRELRRCSLSLRPSSPAGTCRGPRSISQEFACCAEHAILRFSLAHHRRGSRWAAKSSIPVDDWPDNTISYSESAKKESPARFRPYTTTSHVIRSKRLPMKRSRIIRRAALRASSSFSATTGTTPRTR